MNDDYIRKIAQQVYTENQTQGQFTPTKPPLHVHDGSDSQAIPQGNIIVGDKYIVHGVLSAGLQTFNVIANPTSFSFLGFAANNAGGDGTKKAIVNGNVQFGTCYQETGSVGAPPLPNELVPYTQGSNSMYIDVNSAANTRVNSSGVHFIYVVDNTGTEVATAEVIAFDGSSFTIDATLASGWQATGSFIISQ